MHKEQPMKVLGIDGGGTKTAWTLFANENGKLHPLEGKMLGASNLCLVSDADLLLLFQSMPAEVDRVGVFLAGCITQSDRRRLAGLARRVWPDAVRVCGSDRESSLAAALDTGEDGVVVICGTGTAITGRKGWRIERAGGWGHLLGDRGGGYNISVRGLQLVLRSYDLENRLTRLAKSVLKELALDDLAALVSWVQGANKMQIAKLTPLFFHAAEEGNEQVRELLSEGAGVLAEYAAAVNHRLDLHPLKVRLMGGIFRNQGIYRDYFSKAMLKLEPHAEIDLARRLTVEGAAMLAANASLVDEPAHTPEDVHSGNDNLGSALTEQRNPRSSRLDKLSAEEFVDLFVREEALVQRALTGASAALAEALRVVGDALSSGGRLFYVGAGTSGRLGVMDASEIPPTFGASPDLVQGIIAGGEEAVFRSVEGAEDDADAGMALVAQRGMNQLDVVCGIAASGRTPFVLGALAAAKEAGLRTILLTCNPNREKCPHLADVEIDLAVGPELLTGSTRLKAGTATKVALNILSTGAMVRLGKVRGNVMIDIHASNEKLRDRAVRIVTTLAGVDHTAALEQLEKCNWDVRKAVDLLTGSTTS